MSFKCGHIDFGFFSLCSLLGFRHVDHACGLVSLQWLIIILFLFFLFSCFCSCSLSLSISVYVYLFCKMTCTQLASVISFQQFFFSSIRLLLKKENWCYYCSHFEIRYVIITVFKHFWMSKSMVWVHKRSYFFFFLYFWFLIKLIDSLSLWNWRSAIILLSWKEKQKTFFFWKLFELSHWIDQWNDFD